MKPAAACSTYPRVLTGLFHCFHGNHCWSAYPLSQWPLLVIRLLQANISATCFISDDHPATDARREFGIKLLPWLTTKSFILSRAKVSYPLAALPLCGFGFRPCG